MRQLDPLPGPSAQMGAAARIQAGRRRWPRASRWTLAALLLLLGSAVPGVVPAEDSVETPCTACRLWDTTMAGIPEDAVCIEGEAAPNGVVLRVTATDPQVSESLWAVSTQRQRLLESLHRGHAVPLCPDCQANVQAFEDLRIDLLRLPDGVLLLYTSAAPTVVARLHALVTGATLPL